MKRPCLPCDLVYLYLQVQAATTKILPTKCLNIAEPRIFCPLKITRYTVCHLYLKFQKMHFIYATVTNVFLLFLLCRQPCYNYYFVRLGGCNLCLSSERLLPLPSFSCTCKNIRSYKNVIGTVSHYFSFIYTVTTSEIRGMK